MKIFVINVTYRCGDEHGPCSIYFLSREAAENHMKLNNMVDDEDTMYQVLELKEAK